MLAPNRAAFVLLAALLIAPAAHAGWLHPLPSAARAIVAAGDSGGHAAWRDIADAALDGAAGSVAPAQLAAARARVAAAAAVLDALRGPPHEALEAIVAEASALEAGGALPRVSGGSDPAARHAALGPFLARHGVALERGAEAAAALEALPPPARDALGAVVGAFVAFEAAAAEAFAGDGSPGLGPLLAARAALLAAGLRLAAAADALPPGTPDVIAPPAMILRLGVGDDTTAEDVALLVDRGGRDTYLNNAGGSNLRVGQGAEPCPAAATGAGFLLDLGGDDAYASGRSCGANGGAQGGAGMLLDLDGDDVYLGGDRGANGGAFQLGLGLLLDAAGNDTYQAGSFGTNGGGMLAGFLQHVCLREAAPPPFPGFEASVPPVPGTHGALIDLAGRDRYVAGTASMGAGAFGTGFLVDGGPGDDVYEATGCSTGGGAFQGGLGFLLDEGGHDRRAADGPDAGPPEGSFGVHGGAFAGGVGFLLDAGGDDAYLAGHPREPGLWHGGRNGVNGGASFGAVALLIDLAGRDTYQAGAVGTNGGAEGRSVAALLDLGGDDAYRAAAFAANGAGSGFGRGLLLDQAGDDAYEATARDADLRLSVGSANGGASTGGLGMLIDRGGHDRYAARAHGANGGSFNGGVGLLWDASGDDAYVATGRGTNGGGDANCVNCPPPAGLLLDGAGADRYLDDAGACDDCTVVPKGIVGAQLDLRG